MKIDQEWRDRLYMILILYAEFEKPKEDFDNYSTVLKDDFVTFFES